MLFWRASLHYVRNPADVFARLLVAVSIGVLIGLTFLHNTTGTPVLLTSHKWVV